jgi:hypothetical protein
MGADVKHLFILSAGLSYAVWRFIDAIWKPRSEAGVCV